MRHVPALAVALVATLVTAACGKPAAPPPGGGGGAAEGGSAPAPGATGFTKEKAQALVDGVSLGAGWEPGLKKAESDGFVLSWRGPDNDRGAHPNVMASGLSCMAGLCAELSVEAWKKNADNLKMKLSQALKDDPKTVFEIVAVTVDGKQAIGVYALGFVSTTDATGTSRVSTHSFDLYWHDGAKVVTVLTSAGGTSAESADDLAKKLTRAELEATGKKVLGAILAKL